MELFVKNLTFMAIRGDIQNSQRLDPLEITAKKISGPNKLAFQRYFGARN
jgi:hypothetical protein